MKRLAPIAVGLLFFLSGWGQTLAAAFCTHAQGGHACCRASRTSHKHDRASHQEAARPSSGATADGEAASLDQPSEECGHCLSHPRLPAVPIAGAAGQSKPGTGLTAAPPATIALLSPSPVVATAIISRQHAPPGASTPRHALINVFRI